MFSCFSGGASTSRRNVLAVAMGTFAAGAVVTTVATTAAAAPGGVLIPGSSWLQGQGVDVVGNGGNLNTYYQCVELPQMRLYPKFGWPRVYAAGNGGAAYIPEGSPGLTRHNSGSGYFPVPGDLVISNATSAWPYGHVAVVDYASGDSIFVVEQNGVASSGRSTYRYNGGRYLGGPTSVKAVLHAPQNNFRNSGNTSPTTPLGVSKTAFQANTGNLYTNSLTTGAADLGQGMRAGTSPSIVALSSGGYEMSFQANTGDLYAFGDGGSYNTRLGMMSGTSPAIAASPGGGFKIAFQANTGNLYQFGSPGGAANFNLGMKSGTSPAIAALSTGGYQIAFQANTGNLWVTGDAGTRDTGLGMMPGTSPAIAATNGGYKVAFQANTGNLYQYASTGSVTNLNLGMKNGTSPAITALSDGGYEIAFQANTGNLWATGDAGTVDTQLGMMTGTSPSISRSGAGWVAAFQANTGNLYRRDSGAGPVDSGLGMMRGTSPAIG
ncbi:MULTISPECIES: CHAP domain-containing protein [unclassified Rathayibacter]|uniref:CHAP domain-containing protein n=1 Tax=unclassified Rathayibacter TaxID=2609250 RepID=UPI0015E2844B|nr:MULTISPECIES: CHAP domain-containing protein [unclassified Rathayibacter]